MLANFVPYFRYDSTVLETQLVRLDDQLNTHEWFLALSASEQDQVLTLSRKILTDIYQKGLIEGVETQQVELMSGPLDLGQRSVDDFYTPRKALQYLIDQIYDSSIDGSIAPQLLKVLEDFLKLSNVVYDSVLTDQMKERATMAISPYLGKMDEGTIIVRRGQVIDKITFNALNSYRLKYNEQINQTIFTS